MREPSLRGGRPLVVVDHFDILGAHRGPPKADTELIVDADRMLPLSVARESLQAVARRGAEIVQSRGGMEHREFSFNGRADGRAEALGPSSRKYSLCVRASERLNR